MVLKWRSDDENLVNAALRAHPASSSRCAAAARAVLPPALRLDGAAHALLLKCREPYARIKRRGPGVLWHYHVTVHASEHRVDALTGVIGSQAQIILKNTSNSQKR